MGIGYVYFIRAREMNRFKIGKSSVLPKRFDRLETASPCDLELWGVIKSDKYDDIEKKLHSCVHRLRIKKSNGTYKEWFKMSKHEAAQLINRFGGFYTADGFDTERNYKLFLSVIGKLLIVCFMCYDFLLCYSGLKFVANDSEFISYLCVKYAFFPNFIIIAASLVKKNLRTRAGVLLFACFTKLLIGFGIIDYFRSFAANGFSAHLFMVIACLASTFAIFFIVENIESSNS